MPPTRTYYLQPHQFIIFAYILTIYGGFFLSSFFTPGSSYFSQKSNIFNQYFVKVGWAWTTAVYLPLSYTVIAGYQANGTFARALGRWALASAYWYLLSQWFLGPSVIDRVFIATGGICTLDGTASNEIFHSVMCKRRGGYWGGGHDISGHCMLLVHSSLFLIEEIASTLGPSTLQTGEIKKTIARGVVWANVALLALWWWMLFMTSIYFHGFRELTSGTLLGVAFWLIQYVYFYPKSELGRERTE